MSGFNFKNTIKTCWNRFNYWRKRYFYLRLGILLMIAIPLLYERIIAGGEPLICNLVRIACRAIQYSSQPRVISAWLHYNHSLEKQRLLLSLNKIKDQLTPEERAALNEKPTQADLKQLFSIAKKHGLLPKTANLRTMKQAMLTSAIGQTRQRFEPENRKVQKMIDSCSYPDYSKWATWKRGTLIFINILFALCCPYPYIASISWLSLCFFTGAMIGTTGKAKRKLLSILATAAITIALVGLKRYLIYCDYSATGIVRVHLHFYWHILIYQLCLGAICGLLGDKLYRLTERKTGNTIASRLTLSALGLSLILSSLGLFKPSRFYFGRFWTTGNTISLPPLPFLSSILLVSGIMLTGWAIYSLIFTLIKKSGDTSNIEVKTE